MLTSQFLFGTVDGIIIEFQGSGFMIKGGVIIEFWRSGFVIGGGYNYEVNVKFEQIEWHTALFNFINYECLHDSL